MIETVGLMHQIADLFARATTASRPRGARHPALPVLAGGLWMMGCQAVPAATSTPGPGAHATSTPSSGAAEVPKPRAAGRGAPSFVEVADGPCADLPDVIDAEDATFLVSETQAKRAQPGRAELEKVAGLPSPRGSSQGFALHPFILEVERPDPVAPKPDTLAVLGYFLLDPRTHAFSRVETARFGERAAFGDYPIPLPVAGGTLVITFTYGTKRPTDPGYGVPAGDGSAALMASKDGLVSPFPSWPNVLFNMPVFHTDGVIWAMTIRPGMPGNFVLRVPLAGTPKYFPVPGTQGCRGDDRLYPAKLVEEGAGGDEVTVEVDDRSCVTKGAAGRYRLNTPAARWRKQPASSVEGPGTTAGHAKVRPVQVGGAMLRIEGTRALITGPGTEGERDADPDPPGDPAQERSLKVTAGGRDVWLQTSWQTHCRLGRYRSW